jgi:DNA polymerase-1
VAKTKRSKSQQPTLPGWEVDAPSSSERVSAVRGSPDPALRPTAGLPALQVPSDCDFPPAPPIAEMGEDAAELPAEPVEATLVPDLKGKTVWVIDSHSLIFQVFHALPEMTSPRGEPMGAVFGFTRDMMHLLDEKKPDYLFAAFDMSGPTFRHDIAASYKEHRTEMPDDLRPQILSIRRMLAVLAIPILECAAYEADDILATLARITEETGGECVLVTGDKDIRQLISDRVQIYNIRKNFMFDAAALKEEWGVRPDQVVDFQTLVGDSVDNIPGVPLVGPKVAGEWLAKFDTLENLLARADELPKGKRKENLLATRDQIVISRQLVKLDSEVPVPINWDRGRAGGYNPAAAADLFAEFGFHSLTNVMREKSKADLPAFTHKYETIATREKLAWLVEQLGKQTQISVDTETTSLYPRWAEIVGYSFAWKPGDAYYVPVRAPAGEPCLDPAETLATLKPILENAAIQKVGQNLKYDIIVLRSAGVRLAGVTFDTIIGSYLLDAGERNHTLDELASRYLNHATTKIGTLIGSGKNEKRLDEVPVAQVTHYAAEDADVALRLVPLIAPKLEAAKLELLFNDLEVPLVEVLAELEFNGIRVDVDRLNDLSSKFGERIAALELEIFALAGHEFNIASPKQLQTVLFDEQHLPVIKKTKTGPSTDVEVLEELALSHALPAKIIEHRQYSKLKGTYVDALPKLVHPRTGRVHTTFNQVVAATGRLSSNDPNLQNIPIRAEEGREIRSAFLPGQPDWLLLAADYSQIELRVLAHFSADETLRAAFERDEDIHSRVASEVYGVPIDDVTSAMRRVAKAVNFGVIYGQSPFGLAKMLDIEKDEAAKFIDAYFNGYPGVEQFLREVLIEARKQGYVTTVLGRRRAIEGVRDITKTRPGDPASRQRNLPERTAINTVIQGSAADIIKLAMLKIHRRLAKSNLHSKMLLQIHDELIFECPPDELEQLQSLVREEMSGVMKLSVPLKVDLKSGRNWAECE